MHSNAAQLFANAEYSELLYLWTFNQSDLTLDIGILPASAELYTDPPSNYTFTAIGAAAYEQYAAGQALSVAGNTDIYIQIPTLGIAEVHDLVFSIHVTSTGPKGITLTYGSQQNGPFEEVNGEQFIARTNQYYTLEFELPLVDLTAEFIIFKLSFSEGHRAEDAAYNPNLGRVRIDNLRLYGVRDLENGPPIYVPTFSEIQYHIFNGITGQLVLDNRVDLLHSLNAADIEFSLPAGIYHVHFVYNVSNASLVFPAALSHISEFVIHNPFENNRAEIFGAELLNLNIEQDVEQDLILSRYFSEIRFVFTDRRDLSDIGEFIIYKEHDADYFIFSNQSNPSPLEHNAPIHIYPSFEFEGPTIFFNQFLGVKEQEIELQFRVEVLNKAGEIIREFRVSEQIRHNSRLTFSGRLYDEVEGGFSFFKNEDWDQEYHTQF